MDPIQDKVFDENIREKVEMFEPKVPLGIWANIAANLDEKPVVPLRQRSNKLFWLQVAAAVIIFIGAGMFYMNRPRDIIYLTANSKQENKDIMRSEPQPTKPAPLVKENVQEAGSRIAATTFAEQGKSKQVKKAYTAPREQPEGPDLMVSIPVFEHATLEEEVKRPTLAMLRSENREEEELSTFVDETSGLLVEAKVPPKDKRRFGVSDLLNYVVKSVDQREEKLLSFANDEEGTIKVAVNFKALKIKL